MKIIQIIDSLELNGGSTMFLELVSAMRTYWTQDKILPFVVSKTGKYGRSDLTNDKLAPSYGINDLELHSYETFQHIVDKERKSIIFHHILGHTRPIRFHRSCRYIPINHTMTNVVRLVKFKPFYRIVSVCKHFYKQTKRKTDLSSVIVLNKISDCYRQVSRDSSSPFIIGRCQRIVPSKFARIDFPKKIFPNGYKQIIIGPINSGKVSAGKSAKLFHKNDVLIGSIFDRDKKIEMIRNFDVYLHYTSATEGASMAVLEALSCGVPVLANRIDGGIRELINEGVNGYFFSKKKELSNILRALQDKNKMQSLRESTRRDFLSRLHIKYSLNDYRRLIK